MLRIGSPVEIAAVGRVQTEPDDREIVTSEAEEIKTSPPPVERTALKKVSEAEFNDLVQKSERIIFYFTSKSCTPCRLFEPLLEESFYKVKDKVLIVKMDFDELSEQFVKEWAPQLPSVHLFEKGKFVKKMTGVLALKQGSLPNELFEKILHDKNLDRIMSFISP